MHARSAMLKLLLAVGPGLVLVSPASAGPWSLAKGQSWTMLQGGFYSSDIYHDQNGDRHALAGGGLLEQRSVTWAGELGWRKKVSFVYSIPFVSITRRLADDSGPNEANWLPTATGFGDGIFGFKYNLKNGRTAMALELDWKAPLGYERNPTYFGNDSIDINVAKQLNAPRQGEGQQDVSIALHVGTAIGSRGFVQGMGGYKYRFEDPSDQIVLAGDVGLWMGKTWLLGGMYRGQLASTGPNPTRDADLHRVGPVLLYRVDDRLDLFARSLHTASAKNAIHTDEIFVGLAFRGKSSLGRQQGYMGNTK
jgi:hypothetical protein